MTLTPLHFSEFTSASGKDWLEAANSQLRTEDAFGELAWALSDDWRVSPYYDIADVEGLAYLSAHFSEKKIDWHLVKTIDVVDEALANTAALKALNQGCTGVFFRCADQTNFDLLTQHILFNHCMVAFHVPKDVKADVLKFMSANSIQGFCHSPEGLTLSASDSSEEMAQLLVKYSKDPSLNSVVVAIGANFFLEIAKLRALSYLIDRVANVLDRPNRPVWIHAEILPDTNEDKNLLVQSTAGLAAAIGGAHSISFTSKHGQDRMATNVGNLIRDEAKIHTFQDASGGSYFIDSVTDQMIRKVWTHFQNLMS